MATVFLARDLRHDRQVALKVLHPELAATLGPARFQREIRLAARLQHPHILTVHDSGETAGQLWFTMPLVEGESLRDRLRRAGQLPVDDAIRITTDVARALQYAHDHGVVHRDIKPENLLLTKDGSTLVADFGIAQALDAGVAERLTETGLSLGTPAYMSPEQASGDRTLDARSDQFSLACVLYEMLAGEPPFSGATTQAVIAKRFAGTILPLHHVRPSLPAIVERATLRALAPVPADRFPDAAAFAQAIAGATQPENAVPAATTVSGRLPIRSRRRIGWLIGGALVLAILAAVLLRVSDRSGATQAASGGLGREAHRLTVAVLPFENLGPAGEEYFAAGMTDEISSRLGAVSGLGLVPTRAVQRYARTNMTMREIGQELGIDYLLAGSVRWAGAERGSTVRITLQLVRAKDERQLWATTYDREMTDIFKVQSDIAEQVIGRLGVTLPEGERNRLSVPPTRNHEAYTLYLKGRYFESKRTEADIQTALEYFYRAIDLDPGYSRAWVGVADGWMSRGWYSRLAPREAWPKAKSAAVRALTFDSTLAEAHATMAQIHFAFDHDWPAAEAEYRRAIELDPDYPTAHHWYGGYLSGMGRHDEALQQAVTARALDPLSPIIQTWIGLRYYFAGKNDQAIAEYRKALELDPDFAPAHWHLCWAYEQTGRFNEGVFEAKRALAIEGGSLLYLAALGQAYARAGLKSEARATLARLTQASASRHVSSYDVAVIYIAMGETKIGLDWLERAYDEQSPWIGYLRVDPRLAPVRSDPRFEALLKKARLAF